MHYPALFSMLYMFVVLHCNLMAALALHAKNSPSCLKYATNCGFLLSAEKEKTQKSLKLLSFFVVFVPNGAWEQGIRPKSTPAGEHHSPTIFASFSRSVTLSIMKGLSALLPRSGENGSFPWENGLSVSTKPPVTCFSSSSVSSASFLFRVSTSSLRAFSSSAVFVHTLLYEVVSFYTPMSVVNS